MSTNDSDKPTGRAQIEKILDLAFGTNEQIGKMPRDQVSARLQAAGINTEKGWNELQSDLKIAEGKARLAAARAKRLSRSVIDTLTGTLMETKEAIVEQIKGLILLSEDSAVYARKWEESSLEDLKSLRDELMRTAARAAQKKRDEQQR